MSAEPGLSEQYRRASPWPVFVALGLPISELGILFGAFPVTVGGLLLFCGSIAGMLGEAGYVESPWRALAGLSVACLALGAWFLYGGPGLLLRGQAVVAAGVVMLISGLVGELVAETHVTA